MLAASSPLGPEPPLPPSPPAPVLVAAAVGWSSLESHPSMASPMDKSAAERFTA
jgi:hypothetical protein